MLPATRLDLVPLLFLFLFLFLSHAGVGYDLSSDNGVDAG
jgi:hypothetical protein